MTLHHGQEARGGGASTVSQILVVEDNDMVREIVMDLLKLHGHGVLQARSGEEAIELARRDPPDLILMDLGLPGIDGLQTTKVLKEDETTRRVPIAILTAHSTEHDAEKAVQAGCECFISKPFDTRAFPQQIADLLDGNGSHGSGGVR